MLKAKFTALASLGVLAAAPLAAQAEMVEMADVEMADVSGQGIVSFQRWAPFNFVDVLPTFVDGDGINLTLAFNPGNIFNTSYTAANTAVAAAGNAAIGTALLPITAPTSALTSFNTRTGTNAGGLGTQSADIVFKGPFAVLNAIGTGVDSLLLPLTGPTAMVAGFNTRAIANFTSTGQSVADTAVRLVTTPVRAVINPINGAMDDVAALGKGLVSGARFSAVGAVGGATTRVLAGAAAQTNSRLLTNLAYASDQARVQQQNKIGTTMGVTVTVPKYTVSTSLLKP
ncbi:MAG TPA: hypothetical protein PKE41_03570 [Candidatus Macondimonas sp.]|nr:hypothetical protein [Candidatus Macondimonas sp.]